MCRVSLPWCSVFRVFKTLCRNRGILGDFPIRRPNWRVADYALEMLGCARLSGYAKRR